MSRVDLIDLQSNRDGEYKLIMVYQDHLTEFIQLRPLKTKRAEEVAYHVLSIFLIFGAPAILQSDNGIELNNQDISEICAMWKDVKIVHGKPRHSQTQGSVEMANQDIQNMLTAWMNDNVTNKWSEANKSQISKPEEQLEEIPNQFEEAGNTSEKNLNDGHTENHIPKKNIEEDFQSPTSSHQVLTEKRELISKKERPRKRIFYCKQQKC
ncbi:KRAB-A domain-containing protein 2 [Trichonephila clavipes]|nr:KRAB-A domain-containing protein 2 [Trichonephila clavipes]